MVERKVSFGIDLNPGVSQLRSQLAGVTELSRRSLLQIQHAEERHNQKVIELRRALQRVDNDANASSIASHRRMIERIESEEQRHSLRMKQMRERAQMQAMEDRSGGLNLSAMGHLAQSLGFYRTGHLLRAFQQMGVGTQVTRGGGGSIGGAAIGGAAEEGIAGGAAGLGAEAGIAGAGVALAPETLGLSLAIAAVIAGGKLVEMAFTTVAGAAKDLATSFLGAVAQIGGAKGLQEMTVEAAELQRRTGIARLTVAPEERMTGQQIDDLAGQLSTQADLGGFGRDKWVAAINEMGTVTGKQKSFDKQSWEFIGRMANIGGVDPSEVAKVYGTLSYANPTLNNNDVQQLLLSGIGIGRELTFNVGELPQAGRVLQSGFKIGGDRQKALRTSMALAGLMKPFAPSGTLSEAGTMEEALLRELTRAGIRGEGPVNVNRTGQITNINKSLGWALSTPMSQLPKGLLARESGEAITALKQKFGITEKDTPAQVQKKVDDMLAHFDKLALTMDQFKSEADGATGASQKIKARFNELTNDMEGRLLKLLESDAFQKAFDNIIDFLTANAPTLEAALEDMIGAFNALAPLVWKFTEAIFDLLSLLTHNEVFEIMFPELTKQVRDLADSFASAKNQHELREHFANTVYPADFIGPLPPGAKKAEPETVSVPIVRREAETKLDTSNQHLDHIKTLHEKQIDILNAIKENTRSHTPAPQRSSGGSDEW